MSLPVIVPRSSAIPADSPKALRAASLGAWNSPMPGESVVDESIWHDPATDTDYRLPKLPHWVKFAIEVGYVKPGYPVQEYLNAAINGFPGDPVKRAGFNLVAIANELGVGKSSLSRQLSAEVYGEEHAGEWEPDWELVLKYTIHTRDQILPMWRLAREQGGRIKCLNLDDIDSIFSKELWFEDRPLYIKLRKAINKIRPRVANMIVSAPSLRDINNILSTKITFEAMPFPNQSYMVERFCRFVDQFSPTDNYFRKIMTEYSIFELGDEPHDIFERYDANRMESEDEDIGELEAAMKKAEERRRRKREKDEDDGGADADKPKVGIDEAEVLTPSKVPTRSHLMRCLKCKKVWPSSRVPMRCAEPSCRSRDIQEITFGQG